MQYETYWENVGLYEEQQHEDLGLHVPAERRPYEVPPGARITSEKKTKPMLNLWSEREAERLVQKENQPTSFKILE